MLTSTVTAVSFVTLSVLAFLLEAANSGKQTRVVPVLYLNEYAKKSMQ
jgi:hypothetical protein